jgi:hypothetical protein
MLSVIWSSPITWEHTPCNTTNISNNKKKRFFIVIIMDYEMFQWIIGRIEKMLLINNKIHTLTVWLLKARFMQLNAETACRRISDELSSTNLLSAFISRSKNGRRGVESKVSLSGAKKFTKHAVARIWNLKISSIKKDNNQRKDDDERR